MDQKRRHRRPRHTPRLPLLRPSHNVTYNPTTRHAISHTDLEAVAASQGTEFRPGDILLVRSGFVKWHNEANFDERRRGTELGSEWAGVEGTRESVEWLWEKHFAAVGGDANVFEAWPARDERYRTYSPPSLLRKYTLDHGFHI